MLADFEIITHKFPERPDLHIYAIADVHLGAAEHMEREWKNFTAHVLEDPNAYIILGGDLMNWGLKNSVSNVYAETMRPREQKREMAEMLKPLKDRILCAVPGNHERRGMKEADDDPTYDIMCKLDLEHLYRENLAFVRIQMGQQEKSGIKNPTYMLCVTHGAGGGMLPGAVINRNERFGYAIDGIDALIVGHSHKPMVSQPAKLLVDARNNKVTVKPFKVVVASSWLQYGGYAAQKMLLPASHAPQVMTLRGKRKEIRVEM